MERVILLMVAVCLAMTGQAAVTIHMALDCRNAHVVSDAGEEFCYDTSWYANAAQIRITDNGTVIENGSCGIRHWLPTDGQNHRLQLIALDGGGVQVGSETVDFICVPQDGVVTLPEDWTEIPDGTFVCCDRLTSVTIPPNVVRVGTGAFSGCRNIRAVTINGTLVGECETSCCTVNSDRWTDLGAGQYQSESIGASQWTTMSVTLDLQESQSCSFSWKVSSKVLSGMLNYSVDDIEKPGISGLMKDWETVTFSLSAGVHTIRWRYFNDGAGTGGADCGWVDVSSLQAMTKIVAPPSLKTLFPDSYSQIRSVTIPSGVTRIASGVFAGCEALTRVEVASLADWLAISFEDATANPLSSGAKLYVGGMELTTIEIPEGTTSIGDYVFAGSALTAVTIPSSVTNVGTGAFAGCEALTRVEVASLADWLSLSFEDVAANPLAIGAKLYVGGTELTSLEIPEGTTSIGDYAFAGMTLTSVMIPSSVVSIGTGSFMNCTGIASVAVPGNVNVVSVFADSKETITRMTITGAVSPSVFAGCTALTRVDVSSLVDWLPLSFENAAANPLTTGAKLYVGGTELTLLDIPEGTTSIGDYAFAGTCLTSVTIPSSVTSIGAGAFAGCNGLTSIAMPAGVVSVGAGAIAADTTIVVPASMNVASVFADSKETIARVAITGTGTVPASAYAGCTALTRVDVASLTDWLGLSFANAASNPLSTGAKLYVGGTELTSLEVPEGTTSIGAYAFAGADLTSVTIPASVTNVERTAFSGCTDVASVAMPASVNVARVFADSRKKIRSVTIKGRGTVPASAYAGCTVLTRVDVASLPDWLALSFENATANPLSVGAKLYVGGTELTSLEVPEGTTSIGAYAFAGAVLTSVKIPASVTNVAETAFSGCTNIVSVTVPASMDVVSVFADSKDTITRVTITGMGPVPASAYADCTALTRVDVASLADWMGFSFSNAAANPLTTGAKLYVGGTELTSLEVPEGTTSIGDYAFAGTGLTSVTIPSSVTSIGVGAFAGCNGLTSIAIPAGVVSVGAGAIAADTTIVVPASMNVARVFADSKETIARVAITGTGTVPASAYAGCTALTRVDVASLPDWLALSFENAAANPLSTGAKLYVGGTELTSLEIPEGATSIGDYAFAGTGLTSVTIPSSVTSIGVGAFAGCNGLTSVTIPAGVVSVGAGAIAADTTIVVPASMNVASVFSDSKETIARVVITGTGTVPASAYAGCTALTRVDVASLPDWLALSFENAAANPLSTGAKLYVGGTELTSLEIPEGTTSIGDYAFAGVALTSVTVPANVTSIGTGTFSGCTDITSVTVPASMNVASVFADSKTKIGAVTMTGTGTIPASAYAGCTALTRVNVATLSDWLGLSFSNAASSPLSTGAKLYVGGTELVSLEIQDGTTNIGAYAFAGTALKSVTIPPSVTSVGAGAFSGCTDIASVTVPASLNVASVFADSRRAIRSVTIMGTGTVPASAYMGCTDIASVTVPASLNVGSVFADSKTKIKSVTIMGTGTVPASAYTGCTSLTRVDVASLTDWLALSFENAAANPLSTGAKLYVGGTELTSLVIPEGVTNIGAYAFAGADLTSVTIPAGVTSIGTGAFSGCQCIASVTVPASVNVQSVFADSYAALRSLTLTGDLETFDADLLSGCASLTTLVMPNSVKYIEPGAFDDCPLLENITFSTGLEDFGLDVIPSKVRTKLGLAYDANGFMIWNGWLLDYQHREAWSVQIPDGVIGIGHEALSDMAYMDSVEWPEGVRYIGSRAFRNDTYLDNVVIPDSVELIAADAFRGCSYLQNLTVGDGLKSIGDRAFWGCSQLARFSSGMALETIGEAAFSNCWRMQSIALPVGMKNVDPTAFARCTSVTGVTTPSGVATLGNWFSPIVSQIASVTVPVGETNVLPDMFAGCSHIAMVDLPNGVTNIGARAFKNCSSLTTLTLPDTLVTLGAESFYGCSSLETFAMPASVTTMGASALRNCTSLKVLTLSRGLTQIPDYAMEGCSSLDSFTVPEFVTYLGRNFFPARTTAIYYRGVAPQYDAMAYANASSGLTSYVWRPEDTRTPTGWDGSPTSRDLPTSWPTTGAYHQAIEWWSPNQYDVTFDANGGIFAPVSAATYACEQITYTWYALPPFEPTRAGYKFNGYWTERTGGTRIYSSTGVSLTKPHTLYAQWTEAPTVTIRFNPNGGTVNPNSRIYTTGVPYHSFPVPTREHYQFAGWYTEAFGGRSVVEATEAPSADQELFAHWTPCVYTIRFHANNGTGASVDQSFTYGDTVTLRRNTFSCSGCSFAGWALNPGAPAAYADGKTLVDVANIEDDVIHLWACWSGNTYVVRFDSHGGVGVIPNQTFVIGIAQPLMKNVFTREGFQFGGWALTTDSDAVYADEQSVCNLTTTKGATVVLYAVWERPNGKSLVTFETNGGTLAADQAFYTSRAAYGSLPRPTRTGYSFVKWTTREGTTVTSSSFVPQTDITLYAVWKANTYTVVFLANGGEGAEMDPQSFDYGMAQALLNCGYVRTGYTFCGWSTDPNTAEATYADGESVLSLAVDGTLTLYAVWRPNTYMLRFLPNGGQGMMSDMAATYDAPTNLTANAYSRVGYTFEGWALAEDGEARYADQATVSNLTAVASEVVPLYAVWRVNFVEPPVISPSDADGVVFETSQTITMTCAAQGATIHYTRDGSEPTIDSPVYGRFRISGKTTIKARGFLESGVCSEIVTAEYALGRCPDPVIVSAGGKTFSQAGNVVTLNYACDEGVVHYTLDGSEPTVASPIYQAPFTVDETVVVKAKAFSDRYFDSQVVMATLTRTRTKVATPVIVAAASFTGAQTMVDITCATEGAVIYYTLNGSTPNSHSTRYRGPFAVEATTTIKAYATLAEYVASDVVTKTVTKIWGIGDSLGAPGQVFVTSGAAGWVDDGGTAMKSGKITNSQRSVLSTVVAGAGVLSFQWKTSCEQDEEFHEWDHLELKVDGTVVKVLDGITGWITVEQEIEGAGNHTVEWIYVKDDFEFEGLDCAWVRTFVWQPSVQATQTTGVPVPYAWLRERFPTMGGQPSDYEAKGNAAAANGRKVWECYVAGENPNDPASKFAVAIEIVNGNPVVTWSPDLGEDRVYTVRGARDLNGTWVDVTSKAPATRRAEGYRFFKVEVWMK